MVSRAALVVGLVLLAGTAGAEAVSSSLQPKLRPVASAQTPVAATNTPLAPRFLVRPPSRPAALTAVVAAAPEGIAVAPMVHPKPRPASFTTAAAEPILTEDAITAVEDIAFASPLPRARPKGLVDAVARVEPRKSAGWGIFKAAAVRTKPGKALVLPQKGSVCGVSAIRGETVAPVVAKIKSCGISDPVKVTAISGVSLSQPITVDCPTAIALNDWVSNGVQKQFGAEGVKQLLIAGSYTCRPRNNVRGAKISEHGHGRAVDVAGFVLADGSKLTVARDYRKLKAMKAAYKSACGTFGTTLGPGSDGHHEDHMHFDTARYRSGAYCR